MKILCNNLKREVGKKFGEKMGRSAVGGYIFLRYVCPAMVAPEQFGVAKNGESASKFHFQTLFPFFL